MGSRTDKITKRAVDAVIASGDLGAAIRDHDLKGFGARLNRDRTVSYFVEYRAGRGRAFPIRRIVLGRHGALTPKQARDMAKKALARVLAGADPSAERAARRKEMTVADLLRHVLADHWYPKKKPSTAKNFEGMIERTLIPIFGAKRLSDLKRSEIRAWHVRQTSRPRQANLDIAILRKALSFAVDDELVAENAAMGIAPHPEHKRDRVPSDDEMRTVLEAIETAPIRPQAALLFRLLIFTGCRTSEWRTAEWRWIEADGRTLRLPDAAAKAGARPVPLSTVAQALLATAPRGCKYVVPNDAGTAPLPPWSVNDAWELIRRVTRIDDLNVHDLRRAFATRGAGLGATAVVLRDALGHKTMQMTSRYISHQTDPVRELAERIGAQIESLKRPSAPIVSLRKSE
jgi:integrase